MVLISWNVACQRAGSTGTRPNAFGLHPPPPPPIHHHHHHSYSLLSLSSAPTPPSLSLSLCLPQPMKQEESCHLRFLRPDQRSLCPGLRTDGIPSPCCCCWPAVAEGIQNRSLTSAWLLEYADVPRIKGTQRIDTHTHTQRLKTPAYVFIHTDTKVQKH